MELQKNQNKNNEVLDRITIKRQIIEQKKKSLAEQSAKIKAFEEDLELKRQQREIMQATCKSFDINTVSEPQNAEYE